MAEDTKPSTEVFARMREDVYDSLVKSLGPAAQLLVDDHTSPLRCAYMAGVQLVLTKLRQGYKL